MDETKTGRGLCTNVNLMQALASRISRISRTVPTFPSLSRNGTIPCRFFAPTSYANPVPVAIRPASTSSGSPAEEKTHVFVIWAPDYADKDALARRLAVREKHLRETQPGQQAGYYCELFAIRRDEPL